MTASPDVWPTLEAREALLERVRERLTRTRAHLRAALAGRDLELLYSWDDSWPPGATYGGFHRGGLNFPRPDSPQGFAYFKAMSEWPLPSVEAWRTASRHAHARPGHDPAGAAALDALLREAGALTPEALPPQMTIAEGLARLDADAERLAADTTEDLLAGLNLVDPKLRAGVGAREKLVMRWPWPAPTTSAVARVLALLSALTDTVPSDELAPGAWPDDVTPRDVATWAAPRLETVHPRALAHALRVEADAWRATGRPEHVSPAWVSFAVLVAALHEVEESSRTPVIRHSATKAGRAALTVLGAGPGLPDIAYPWRPAEEMTAAGSVVELVWDGRRRPVQLRLDLANDHARINWVAVSGILDELHEDGLRDWLILHRMAGEQGATGVIGWTWADHKAHSSYARQVTLGKASDAELAAATVARLWKLKRAEIRLYDAPLADGSTAWARVGPGGLLDIPAGVIDPTGRDRLAVIELNPEIYAGAKRNTPTPHFMLLAESAIRLPAAALRLLSFLACDWQYTREDGLHRDAATLWDYAAIRARHRTPRKRWPELERTLERLLETLAEKGHLADWHHDGGQGDARRYHLDPPQWWKDQAIHGVPPVFGKSLAETPKTGAALKVWREDRKWSLAELATRAGVSKSTLSRAEREPRKPLSTHLVTHLRPL